MNKPKLLKAFLYLGALYYAIGAFAHYFGLTLFPWYDGKLYTPYQDTLIAFVALVVTYILIVAAKNPEKNIDLLNAIIVCIIGISLFSIAIIWKIDFAALGAYEKKMQTIVEGMLGLFWAAGLLWLHPRRRR